MGAAVTSLRVLLVVTAELPFRRLLEATTPLDCLSLVLDASDLESSPRARIRGGTMLSVFYFVPILHVVVPYIASVYFFRTLVINNTFHCNFSLTVRTNLHTRYL